MGLSGLWNKPHIHVSMCAARENPWRTYHTPVEAVQQTAHYRM